MDEVEINVKEQPQVDDDRSRLTRIEKIRRTCSFNARKNIKNIKRDDIDFHAGLIVTVTPSMDVEDASHSAITDDGLGDTSNFLTENYKNYSDMPEEYLKSKYTEQSENSAEESSFFDTIHNNQMEATVGVAALTSAALVVHPVLFLAGVVWAVGLYKSAEAGVVYFNDEAFKRIFWWDEEQECTDAETHEEKLERLERVKAEVENKIKMEGSFEADDAATTQTEASSTTETITEDYVAIENLPKFVRKEKFVGEICGFLKCLIYDEQFNVDFQKKQGDDDIIYTKFENETDSHLSRKITFKTLTKSYFGPAYAHATKTQHIHFFKGAGKTQIDDPDCDTILIDSVTKLKDIPYAEKFWVTERSVVRSNADRNKFNVDFSYEVHFTKKLKIEDLIVGKSAQKVKEITKRWIKAVRPRLVAYNKTVVGKEASVRLINQKLLCSEGVETKIIGNVRDVEVLDQVMLPA